MPPSPSENQLDSSEPTKPAPRIERKPCPMCGDYISVAAPMCRFCGEDLIDLNRGRQHRASDNGARSVKWFRCHACVLGVYWVLISITLAFEVLPVFFDIVIGIRRRDTVVISLAILTVPSFVTGLLVLWKRRWAFYAALMLSYAGVVIMLSQFEKSEERALLRIIVSLSVVVYAHYVVSSAGGLLRRGIPLTAKPKDFY